MQLLFELYIACLRIELTSSDTVPIYYVPPIHTTCRNTRSLKDVASVTSYSGGVPQLFSGVGYFSICGGRQQVTAFRKEKGYCMI